MVQFYSLRVVECKEGYRLIALDANGTVLETTRSKLADTMADMADIASRWHEIQIAEEATKSAIEEMISRRYPQRMS